MFSGKCTSAARLDGKTAIVTGSNTGIGKVTAKEFYRIGAKVIVACRDVKKAEQAVTEIVADVKGDNLGQLVVEELDLASFASIKRCAKNILQKEKNIHLLVNNAGVMACPKGKTQDGFETQFGVNHLGHFLFTSLLLPRIRNSTPARIVNVSSMAHTRGVINFEDINYDANYSSLVSYSQSKLANVLFSKELSKRLEGTGVHVYSLHPGIVQTELGRTIDQVYFPGMRFLARLFLYPWLKTPEQGAQTTLHCSIDEKAGEENGLYYSDCKVKEPSALAKDPELAKKLWDKSIEMVGLKDYDMFNCEDTLPEPLKDIAHRDLGVMFSSKCKSKARLDGKTAIVTGSNTGIGKVTAGEFYRLGAKVILACRDVKKAEQAVTEIVAEVQGDGLGQLIIEELDLASFASIKRCTKSILQKEKQIHLLVNNAGVMTCPKGKTEDGFELQFGINHLGHLLFTLLLLPRIRSSAPARIVIVSSLAHIFGSINFKDINHDSNYSPAIAYSQSKLANVLFSKELSRKLEGTGVHVYSLHPGIVRTELTRTLDQVYFPGMWFLGRIFLYPWVKNPKQGAQTTLYCSIDEKSGAETGLYYSDCKVKEPSASARDPELAKKLWETSIEMVGLKDYDMFNCSGDTLPEPLKDV
ncbi:uncharacterized protein LOC113555286 [Rhopalosiphum maidis]|uniref:uncharacterized protein LOC113555286 n=1 Tax=Rhopalosiphum maidis TaxID=43146 RepID=UPI00101BDB4F|nr:uncharacterized protein LOC113555286 [Rhopalosiphum maidis]